MNSEEHIIRLEAQIERLRSEVTETNSKMSGMALSVEISVIKWIGTMILCAMGAFVITTCIFETTIGARSKKQKIEAPVPSPQEQPQSG
jgi:hypothetical protein